MKRNKLTAIVAKCETEKIGIIRSERNYRIPKDYVTWDTMSSLVAIALSTCDKENLVIDPTLFIHSYHLALWYVKDAPIYCISPELLEALNNTDALHKANIMAYWQPSLPYFILAIPKGTLNSPSGEIDYLVVTSKTRSHPEWNRGQWHDTKFPDFDIVKHDLYFQWATIDKEQTCWFGGTAIDSDGSLIYQEKLSLGRDFTEPDIDFTRKIRNLIINVLLLLEHSADLIGEVSAAETRQKPKGFSIENPDSSNTRYPRWLGKGYRYSQEKSTATGSHASPRSHWRRGNWRSLSPEDGKPWKQQKRLWIQPILVNG